MKYSIIPGLTLLIGMPLSAAEVNVTPLEPIVITGTKTEKSISSSPVHTKVITSEEIQRQQATTLAEVIEGQPNLMLSRIHGQDGSELMMQGMSGNHILILKDGIPIHQDGATGVNLDRIQLGDVERIEIVPGNASVLYGSSAMGGVINIITRDQQSNRLTLTVQARQNEEDKYTPSQTYYALDHGIKLGRWHLASQWDITQRNAYDIPKVDQSEDISALDSWHGRESLTFSHNADSTSNIWLAASADEHERSYQQQLGSLYFPYQTNREYQETELGYRFLGNTWDMSLLAQENESLSDQDNLNTSYLEQRRETKSGFQNFNINKTLYAGAHDISAGYAYSRTTLKQTKQQQTSTTYTNNAEIERTSNDSHEVYLQDDWYATDNLEIVSGVRSQWSEDYGTQTVPNVSLRWDANNRWYVRTSLGIGYREPNLKERYYQFDHSTYGYEVIGNPNLKPELARSFSIETGTHNASITAFYKQLTDLIDTKLDSSVNNGLDTYRYHNIDRAIIYGVELHGTKRLGDITLNADYQWLQTEDKDTGLELDRRPEHQASISASHPISLPFAQSGIFNISGRYVGEQFYSAEDNQTSPDYITLDASLAIAFSPRWNFTVSARNLLDIHANADDESDLRPQVGRHWLATLTYSSN